MDAAKRLGLAGFVATAVTFGSAALLLFGIGSILGPAFVGAAADEHGLETTFLFVAALAISTSLIRPASEGADPASIGRRT